MPLPFEVKGPPSVPDSPSVKTPDARDILKRQRQRLASLLDNVPEEAVDSTDDEMVEERPKKRVKKRLSL